MRRCLTFGFDGGLKRCSWAKLAIIITPVGSRVLQAPFLRVIGILEPSVSSRLVRAGPSRRLQSQRSRDARSVAAFRLARRSARKSFTRR